MNASPTNGAVCAQTAVCNSAKAPIPKRSLLERTPLICRSLPALPKTRRDHTLDYLNLFDAPPKQRQAGEPGGQQQNRSRFRRSASDVACATRARNIHCPTAGPLGVGSVAERGAVGAAELARSEVALPALGKAIAPSRTTRSNWNVVELAEDQGVGVPGVQRANGQIRIERIPRNRVGGRPGAIVVRRDQRAAGYQPTSGVIQRENGVEAARGDRRPGAVGPASVA